mmetsp:Transcript_36587/g.82471  ORF Transcript_36587/g.82471 Transcript_36587/m.82471 type:complete len:224 (+) Transcript_36587:1443-2114(+)
MPHPQPNICRCSRCPGQCSDAVCGREGKLNVLMILLFFRVLVIRNRAHQVLPVRPRQRRDAFDPFCKELRKKTIFSRCRILILAQSVLRRQPECVVKVKQVQQQLAPVLQPQKFCRKDHQAAACHRSTLHLDVDILRILQFVHLRLGILRSRGSFSSSDAMEGRRRRIGRRESQHPQSKSECSKAVGEHSTAIDVILDYGERCLFRSVFRAVRQHLEVIIELQ